ncbi:sensor histidine kinase [Nocardioides antri]|uniref:histidine kinase n=1 Tax=Nocardioides antri TaxID=2607659 RepID=A0A5B1M5A0_9ACTN|nr:sensor histidine kinase [Nocardioides antri]KAA1428455.1 sensor histidine kinase [Nocardioides antri]
MAHLTAELTRVHRAWWPWALALVIVLGTWGSNRELVVERPVARIAVLIAVLAVIPLLLGASHHISLVFTGLWTGFYFAGSFADGPMYLALPALTYLYASSTAPRRLVPWTVVAAGLAASGFVGGALRDSDHRGFWQAAGFLAITAAAGAVGAALRSRTEAAAERGERAATEERLRMAQDLHDGVGHGLAVIAMQAGAALHVLDQDPERARASLEAIRATSKESLDALRSELAVMSGAALRRPAVGLAELPALLDRVRAAGLRVDVVGSPGEVADEVGEVAYVVVQEALTNVLRHAGAGAVSVEWGRQGDRLVLAVRDDGRGGAVQDEGMGIGGMRARVARLGGSLWVGPRAGGGFEVVAELPA